MQEDPLHLRPFDTIRAEGGDDVTTHSPRARRSTVEAEQPEAYNPVLAGNTCCSACTMTDTLKLQTTIAGSFRVNLVCPHQCFHTWTQKHSHFGLETTSAKLRSLLRHWIPVNWFKAVQQAESNLRALD